ncbi:hypothetical protein H4R20_004393 [Coemansia guatemalensis]|uniref:Thioredoxin-like fold domain-containing protein n=1 Tax=Coemansia guatemalensis TaxID=2761395 RepID=A0A9W8HS49_9FUNG|nr:hypothetical protein H4R20_004393 [Coemansia guatemalensis]
MDGVPLSATVSETESLSPNTQLKVPLLPPSPMSPDSRTGHVHGKQRTMHLGRASTDVRPMTAPWLSDKNQRQQQHQQQQQIPALQSNNLGSQKLRLPKRRAMSAGRGSTPATIVEDTTSAMARPIFGYIAEQSTSPEEHSIAIEMGQSQTSSLAGTLNDEAVDSFVPEQSLHVRGTRSMSVARSSIALSASSRASLSHRLSQSSHQFISSRASAVTALPIGTRPRFNSAMSTFSPHADHQRMASDIYRESSSAELTIRLSMDASQSRSYRMLVEGDTVMSNLRVLEDEQQRMVSATQASLGKKMVVLYFAATWSADCDEFTPLLLSVSSAHRDDLAVVHVSLDNHPADMARMMAGTGWLCVPWSEHGLRQDLARRMEVSVPELPKVVVIDGHTHHIISATARSDIERRPLTCVREWKRSRAGLSWWNKAKPW